MTRVLAVASGMATCLMLVPDPAQAQQVPVTEFRPPIANPTYPLGTGPIVLIDEAHSNFHTATGLYRPFAELLRRDGYVVRGSAEPFTRQVRAPRHRDQPFRRIVITRSTPS